MTWIANLISAVGLMLLSSATVNSQIPDHLKCYKVADPLKLTGTLDLDTPQFGVDAGCRMSKAVLLCVPATKANVDVTYRATGVPIIPVDLSGPDPGDRLCYKVKCPTPLSVDQLATDQFGT